jgi:hypothetical protein
MSKYKITDPQSGKAFFITGDSPPSEEEIEEIVSQLTMGSPQDKKLQISPGEEPKDQNSPVSREHTRQILARASAEDLPAEQMPDVLLDIPTLKVDEIRLLVNNLDARVALRAGIADLVRIDVGAQVGIEKVDLDIKGVEAQALLKVRLNQVKEILSRALDTVDRNPELLLSLIKPIGEGVGIAGKELGSEVGNTVGELGSGLNKATGEIGTGAGKFAEDVGTATGSATGKIATGAAKATEETGAETKKVSNEVGAGVNKVAEQNGAKVSSEPMRQVEASDTSVQAKDGPVYDSVRDVSKGVDSAVEPKNNIVEKERRKMTRVDMRKIKE